MCDSEESSFGKSRLWQAAVRAGLDLDINQRPSITGNWASPYSKKAYYLIKQGMAEEGKKNYAEALKIYKECVGNLKIVLEKDPGDCDLIRNSIRESLEDVQSWVAELEVKVNGSTTDFDYLLCIHKISKL